MASLYDLSQDYLEMLEEMESEEKAEMLITLKDDIDAKIINGIGLIRSLENLVTGYKEEIKRLSDKKRITEKR